MAAVKIGISRPVAIPKELHDQLGLTPGDYLEIEVRDNRLVLTPKTLIEKRLAEGLDDLERGRTYAPFSSPSAPMRSLHHEAKQRKRR
jgi:AbrB family looped-hinge helix DNA binding protein